MCPFAFFPPCFFIQTQALYSSEKKEGKTELRASLFTKLLMILRYSTTSEIFVLFILLLLTHRSKTMRQKVSWRLELGAAAMIVALCCFNPVVEAFVPRPSKKCPTLSSPSSRNLCSTSLLPTGTPISLPRCETRMRSSVVDSPSDVEPEINGNSVEEEDDYETPVLTA